MNNRANAMGANAVDVSDDIAFVTSVTFYGQPIFVITMTRFNDQL